DADSNTWTSNTCDTTSGGASCLLVCNPSPSKNKWVVWNTTNEGVASIDENGYMFLRESLFESQGSLKPPDNSFIIEDKTGTPVAYINGSGSLFLTGTAHELATMSPSGSNFEIWNSAGPVAYFTSTGDLYLKKILTQNYASP
ncbi:hypothetical protein D6789_03705, partial [Candidatus Woesearchaeota archaeon]